MNELHTVDLDSFLQVVQCAIRHDDMDICLTLFHQVKTAQLPITETDLATLLEIGVNMVKKYRDSKVNLEILHHVMSAFTKMKPADYITLLRACLKNESIEQAQECVQLIRDRLGDLVEISQGAEAHRYFVQYTFLVTMEELEKVLKTREEIQKGGETMVLNVQVKEVEETTVELISDELAGKFNLGDSIVSCDLL